MSVHTERSGPVSTIIMERPNVRNAVDPATADALVAEFEAFNRDPQALVAVFFGSPGTCVAGGMERARWCDLRVMEEDAFFGVYCRRWGVPLIDGGTVRLPRIVGRGRALDIILTGRKGGAGGGVGVQRVEKGG